MEHEYIVESEKGYIFIDDKDKRKRTKKAVAEINKLSNLPCDLLKKNWRRIDKMLAKNGFNEVIDNYMSVDFYGEDGMIMASGYPHDEANYYITAIELDSKKYDVLGIKVGSYIKRAQEVLISYGYVKIEEEN